VPEEGALPRSNRSPPAATELALHVGCVKVMGSLLRAQRDVEGYKNKLWSMQRPPSAPAPASVTACKKALENGKREAARTATERPADGGAIDSAARVDGGCEAKNRTRSRAILSACCWVKIT
jgi:hypothetical protein